MLLFQTARLIELLFAERILSESKGRLTLGIFGNVQDEIMPFVLRLDSSSLPHHRVNIFFKYDV